MVKATAASLNGSDGAKAEGEYTIDELAQLTGVTTRNIRAHTSRGLLAPPTVRGRTGFYNHEHVVRLQAILRMQSEGFNLSAIKRLIESLPGGDLRDRLDFERSSLLIWVEEDSEVVELSELMERFQVVEVTEALLERMQRIGLFSVLPNGRVEVLSPSLVRAAEDLLGLGISLDAVLDIAVVLREYCDSIADQFVALFRNEIFVPFEQGDNKDQDWGKLEQVFQHIRPLAGEALNSLLKVAMEEKVEAAVNEYVKDLAAGRKIGPKSPRTRGSRSSGRRLSADDREAIELAKQIVEEQLGEAPKRSDSDEKSSKRSPKSKRSQPSSKAKSAAKSSSKSSSRSGSRGSSRGSSRK